MPQLCIALTVMSVTPLSLGAGGSAGTLADKTILRDARGRPLIPGSQVKGKVRHAAEALLRGLDHAAEVPDSFDEERKGLIRVLFGSPQCRSPLVFADLIGGIDVSNTATASIAWSHVSQIRPAVAINRRRGVADDQRLLFQETAPEGLHYTCEKAICGSISDTSYAALLWAALRLTTRWGSASSRGLGWSHVTVLVQVDGHAVPANQLAEQLKTLLKKGA